MKKRLDNMLHTLYNRYRDLKKGLSSWNVNAPRVHVERSNLWDRTTRRSKYRELRIAKSRKEVNFL